VALLADFIKNALTPPGADIFKHNRPDIGTHLGGDPQSVGGAPMPRASTKQQDFDMECVCALPAGQPLAAYGHDPVSPV